MYEWLRQTQPRLGAPAQVGLSRIIMLQASQLDNTIQSSILTTTAIVYQEKLQTNYRLTWQQSHGQMPLAEWRLVRTYNDFIATCQNVHVNLHNLSKR